jgi:hypothetical protein
MNQESPQDRRLTEAGVREDLQRQPHLLMKLAENALIVAENLRHNYFKNTTEFIKDLRRAMQETAKGQRSDAILTVHNVENAEWSSVQGEVVTFIDGGLGQYKSQVRSLYYCVLAHIVYEPASAVYPNGSTLGTIQSF